VVADGAGELFDALAELLRHTAADLADVATVRDLTTEARAVGEKMHALLASAEPLGATASGTAGRYQRWRLLVSNSASCARGIADGFPLAAEMSDADARCRLAALATTLAELADTLGDLAQVVSGRAAELAGGLWCCVAHETTARNAHRRCARRTPRAVCAAAHRPRAVSGVSANHRDPLLIRRSWRWP
jgi:ABC-type transporter Mla subunit MlaD